MLCEKFFVFFLVSIDSFFFWLFLYLSDQIVANYIELLSFSVVWSVLRKIWANFYNFFCLEHKCNGRTQLNSALTFLGYGLWNNILVLQHVKLHIFYVVKNVFDLFSQQAEWNFPYLF